MAWEITTEELLKKYTSGKRNFAGAIVIRERGYDRQFIDLECAVLRDINLRGADLSRADLSGADLSGADLFSASLIEARLDGAMIKDANLDCVNLCRCTLTNADLTGSSLHYVNAIDANFRGAKIFFGGEHNVFIGTNFQGTSIPHDGICRAMNVIWDTVMPDGTIQRGPYFGEWKTIRK